MPLIPFPGGVAAIDKLSRTEGALSVLVRFSRTDAMSMREFELASRLPTKKARKLRGTMQEMGLIDAKVVATRGVADYWEIRPTILGRRVIRRALELNEMLEIATEAGSGRLDDAD